jgi:N-methylhydantoinase A
MMRLRVGVDSGGTFTDICMFDEATGNVHVWKVSSTPQDPSMGIATGIEQGLLEVSRIGGRKTEVIYFGHGTTVATNALIVGRGAETGMITTAGFRDVLELRRQKRDSLYDLQTERPTILARRDKRLEVRERVLFDGSILIPLDEVEVRETARRLREAGVRPIAVCFLFNYLEPRHELMVKRILAEEIPDAFISVSHEVAPEFREYERFSTTVVNAYLGPIMQRYLSRLRPRLAEIGVSAPAHLTQSNGGIICSDSAQRFPARTVLSGPAAADPGPICYDRGNTDEPTVTDANVVPQVLNPNHLLDGRLAINQAKAKQAIARLGERLDLGVMEMAQGIISVVVANMAKAIRVISVERGYDPRDYCMLACGFP